MTTRVQPEMVGGSAVGLALLAATDAAAARVALVGAATVGLALLEAADSAAARTAIDAAPSGVATQLPTGSAAAPSISFSGDSDTGIHNPGANRLSFAANGAAVGEFNGSNFQFNSGYGSVATAFGCRAWVNFNGTGTVAIRASGNVTSITDNGVGDYRVNFAGNMPDANYAVIFTPSSDSFATSVLACERAISGRDGATTSSVRLLIAAVSGPVAADVLSANVVVIR